MQIYYFLLTSIKYLIFIYSYDVFMHWKICACLQQIERGGCWLYHFISSIISLAAGALKGQPCCLVIIILRHAPVKMTPVLVLCVILPILYFFILLFCIMDTVNESEVVDCTHELSFHIPFDLFFYP